MMTRRFQLPWLWPALLIAGAIGYVYAPVIRGEWLWDDNSEITTNLDLRGSNVLEKIWMAPSSPDYFPLKSSVQWLQWRLWQDHATTGYHLTSIALHLIGALLFWRLLAKLRVRSAWLGGLLWAVHPLAVESVAWIAELKNVLSLPPLLLALWAWIDYDEKKQRQDYFFALGWFVVAGLCKSSVVPLPLVLWLYAFWKRGRVGRSDLRATAPFFAVAAGLGGITIWFQHQRAISGWDIPLGGFFARLATAGLAAGFYLWKSFFPFGLSPIYPRWPVGPPQWWQFLPGVLLAGLLFWFWKKRTTWGRHVLLGVGFFLLNLLPVLGFINMSYLHITWVTDHFVFLSLLGIVGLSAAGIGEKLARFPTRARRVGAIMVVVALAFLARTSREYARIFRSPEALWSYTVEHNPGAWTAHNNLGVVWLKQEKPSSAVEHFEAALRLNPGYATAAVNLGNAQARLGRIEAAIESYRTALRLEPDSADAHYNFANLLGQIGQTSDAIVQYDAALRYGPASVDVHSNLANALARVGRLPEAAAHYRQVLRLKPDSAEGHLDLGNVLAASDRMTEAVEHFEAAVRLEPNSFEGHYSLADALASTARLTEALGHYAEAARLNPGAAAIHTSYGNALAQAGRPSEAVRHYEAALRLRVDDEEARANLNLVRSRLPGGR